MTRESKGRSRRARYERGCPQIGQCSLISRPTTAWRSSRRSATANGRRRTQSDGDRNDRRDRQCGRGGARRRRENGRASRRRARLHRRYDMDATGLDPWRKPPPIRQITLDGKADSLPTRKLLLDIGSKCESRMDDAPRRTVKKSNSTFLRSVFHQTKTQFLHCGDMAIPSKQEPKPNFSTHCQPRPERHPTRHRSRHKRRREAEAGQEDEST